MVREENAQEKIINFHSLSAPILAKIFSKYHIPPSVVSALKPPHQDSQYLYAFILDYLREEYRAQALIYEMWGQRARVQEEVRAVEAIDHKLHEYADVRWQKVPRMAGKHIDALSQRIEKLYRRQIPMYTKRAETSTCTYLPFTDTFLIELLAEKLVLLQFNLKYARERIEWVQSMTKDIHKELENGDFRVLERTVEGRFIIRDFEAHMKRAYELCQMIVHNACGVSSHSLKNTAYAV